MEVSGGCACVHACVRVRVESNLCCLAQLKEAVVKLQDDQSMEIEMLKRAYAVTLQGGHATTISEARLLSSSLHAHWYHPLLNHADIEGKHSQELADLKRKHQRGKETIEVCGEPPPLFSRNLFLCDICLTNPLLLCLLH